MTPLQNILSAYCSTCFTICSDAEIGTKRETDEDIVETFVHELRPPATTDARRIATEVTKRYDAQHMSVISIGRS